MQVRVCVRACVRCCVRTLFRACVPAGQVDWDICLMGLSLQSS